MKQLFALLGVLSLAALSFGKGLTGSISGNLIDPPGSAVAGVPVKVTNVSTNQVRQATTDANGHFVFEQLLPGTFRLEVSAKGLKR